MLILFYSHFSVAVSIPQHGACNEFQMYFRMALSCRMGEKIIPPKSRLQGLFPAVWKSHPAYKAGRKHKPLPHKLSSSHHDCNLFIWDKKPFLSSFSGRVFCFYHLVQHLMQATHMQSFFPPIYDFFYTLRTHKSTDEMMLALKRHFRNVAVIPSLSGSRSSCHWVFFGRNNGKVKSYHHKFYFIKSQSDLCWKGG